MKKLRDTLLLLTGAVALASLATACAKTPTAATAAPGTVRVEVRQHQNPDAPWSRSAVAAVPVGHAAANVEWGEWREVGPAVFEVAVAGGAWEVHAWDPGEVQEREQGCQPMPPPGREGHSSWAKVVVGQGETVSTVLYLNCEWERKRARGRF